MLCESCYYYSMSRVGPVCMKTGLVFPKATQCEYFYPRSAEQLEREQIVIQVLNLLRELSKVDLNDREKLHELKVIAKLLLGEFE